MPSTYLILWDCKMLSSEHIHELALYDSDAATALSSDSSMNERVIALTSLIRSRDAEITKSAVTFLRQACRDRYVTRHLDHTTISSLLNALRKVIPNRNNALDRDVLLLRSRFCDVDIRDRIERLYVNNQYRLALQCDLECGGTSNIDRIKYIWNHTENRSINRHLAACVLTLLGFSDAWRYFAKRSTSLMPDGNVDWQSRVALARLGYSEVRSELLKQVKSDLRFVQPHIGTFFLNIDTYEDDWPNKFSAYLNQL